MQILLWLVPPVVVTVVTMAWVGWLGRAGRGVVDRDEAVRRLGAALDRQPRVPTAPARAPRFRSTGVALRRATPSPPPLETAPVTAPVTAAVTAPVSPPVSPPVTAVAQAADRRPGLPVEPQVRRRAS